jgi:sugar phosphate isomerase/epimerase
MRVALPGRPHLTYCTNIHPGESLAEVRHVVGTHVARVKAIVSPGEAFGVGLRLSARAAEELAHPGELEAFRALLDDVGAYAFTINGFPYGAFHGARVKERVYRPDWGEDDRVRYSDRLAELLCKLLPEGVSGSVSTVPGAFGPRATTQAERDAVRAGLVRHVATLARLRESTGKSVIIALEPEPSCLLETVQDTCRFFGDYVFSSRSIAELGRLTGLSHAQAEAALREHVGVCLDACHLAVEFEDAKSAVAAFSGAGIRIGKVQVTDALVARFTGDPGEDERVLDDLERFSDDVYLHQVVERRGASLTRYLDLPDALRAARAPLDPSTPRPLDPSEWRIHFHVPIFHDKLGRFASTQPFLRDLFDVLRGAPVTEHLEVETYTWDLLPAEHRGGTVEEAIARELEFAIELASRPRSRENGP